MRMVDIIHKKKDGRPLSGEEIAFFVKGCTDGSIPDYQTAALLMAVVWRGMSPEEITALTLEMARSGDMVDLSTIPGTKVDKHSTGGVGDKTTLIVGPIVASLGVPVAKMSGKGLGHTGGTIDKLEAIPGLRTAVSQEEFLEVVSRVGISIVGQSGNLAPADKKLYALRDVTATVESIPLIAASIMSKKIAAGAQGIVLDVKTGSGALVKTQEEARALAEQMVRIGSGAGRATVALITDMDVPLGHCIGNSLEVQEAVDTLRGHGPKDLTDICTELSANMVHLALGTSIDEARVLCTQVLGDGRAFAKLEAMVGAQGGDVSVLNHGFPSAKVVQEWKAGRDGYIQHMDSAGIGTASMLLGAGRATKDDIIDYTAGIELLKKTGERAQEGEAVARLHTSSEDKLPGAVEMLAESVVLGAELPKLRPLILERITADTL